MGLGQPKFGNEPGVEGGFSLGDRCQRPAVIGQLLGNERAGEREKGTSDERAERSKMRSSVPSCTVHRK